MSKIVKSLPRILELRINSKDVNISKSELAFSLGYSDQNIPEQVDEVIDQSMELIHQNVMPSGGFVILRDKNIIFDNHTIVIDDICLLSEKIISKYLKYADTIAILVATIGNSLEKIVKQQMDQNEFLSGYVIDKAASELVEKTAQLVEDKLFEITAEINLSITNRYSPGYCGWSVSDQHKLFSLLPEGFCGINLTESSLMIPIKSVSAIIGIGGKVRKEDYACKLCEIDFCYKKHS
ncbi:MAG TPA: vitamin B12 dependent-methionine synthase activation domain-containing protein [Ignavibacteriaceae bacterium]|nr:vitamin B12 dependent-methionine synthase activation domain-containing protein [Ignavibacteriaceae bacterium]